MGQEGKNSAAARGTLAGAVMELLVALPMIWNVLQSRPSHTVLLRLFTPKNVLLYLGGTLPIELMPQLLEVRHLLARCAHDGSQEWVGGTPNLS